MDTIVGDGKRKSLGVKHVAKIKKVNNFLNWLMFLRWSSVLKVKVSKSPAKFESILQSILIVRRSIVL